jgi:hypothetical protein
MLAEEVAMDAYKLWVLKNLELVRSLESLANVRTLQFNTHLSAPQKGIASLFIGFSVVLGHG